QRQSGAEDADAGLRRPLILLPLREKGLDPFADLDGGLAADLDDAAEQAVGGGLAAAVLDGVVVVGQFLFAELRQFGGEVWVAVADLVALVGVVFLDDALDRRGAGVGGLFRDQGRPGS